MANFENLHTRHRPAQATLPARVTPGAAGFLILSQVLLRPDRLGASRRLQTMPSSPKAPLYRSALRFMSELDILLDIAVEADSGQYTSEARDKELSEASP